MRCSVALFGIVALTGVGVFVTVGCENKPSTLVGSSSDPVVMVEKDDKELTAARQQAVAQLPKFWEALANPKDNEGDFALKVAVSDGESTEYFWCNDLERKEGKLSGVINNEPTLVKNVKEGERIAITDDKVWDFVWSRGDNMVGNFTARVLIKRSTDPRMKELAKTIIDP